MARTLQLYLLASFLLLGIANAGTVSLTGSCRANLLAGNILNFSIVNTGNDTAYGLILSPFISGAQPQNSSYPIGNLPPNINMPILIPLNNILGSGTYADSFVVTYQQGTSSFTALFPCIVNIGRATTSAIYLTANTVASRGSGIVNVSVFNGVRDSFRVNVSALFPPTFKFTSPPFYILNMSPYQTRTVQFSFSYPISQSSYTGAVASRYTSANLSYASLAPIVVSTKIQASQSPINLVLIASVALVILIILLIIRSVSKKKSAEKSHE